MDPVTISMLFSAGVSAYQAYKSNADAKKADIEAQRLGAQLRATREADMVSGLQVPQMGAELARQALGQQMASSINALTSAGAAGVLGGVPGLANVGAEQALKIAAQLNTLQAQRDQFVAGALQGIEYRDVKAQREMLGDQLKGAQLQSAEARQNRNQAIATGAGAIGKGIAAEIGDQPLYTGKQSTVKTPISELQSKKLDPTPITFSAPNVSQISLGSQGQMSPRMVTNLDVQTDEVPLDMNLKRQPFNLYSLGNPITFQ